MKRSTTSDEIIACDSPVCKSKKVKSLVRDNFRTQRGLRERRAGVVLLRALREGVAVKAGFRQITMTQKTGKQTVRFVEGYAIQGERDDYRDAHCRAHGWVGVTEAELVFMAELKAISRAYSGLKSLRDGKAVSAVTNEEAA